MTSLPVLLIFGGMVCVIVFFMTHQTPLYWLGHLLVILEAALFCAGRVLADAARAWWRRMPGVLAELRAKFAGDELEKILGREK